jgi:hypothetical protein
MTLKHLLVATAVGAGLLAFGTIISEPPALPEFDREEARGALLSGVSPGAPAAATSTVQDENRTAVAAPGQQDAEPRKLLAQSSVRRWVFPHGPKY